MKRILFSLLILSSTGALAVGVSRAFFSDTEKSTGNTFTAGAIDLKVDYKGYYNNPVGGTPNIEWTLKDLSTEKFFDFADVKPGDYGEGTISLHIDNNDAWACMTVTPVKNDDMSSTEPELKENGETPEDPNNLMDGELAQNLTGMIWADVCATNATPGDNIYQVECDKLIGTGIAPLTAVTLPLADAGANVFTGTPGPLLGLGTYFIGTSWSLPGATGNIAQTDSYVANISFSTVQHKNNPNFRCIPPIKVERTQQGFGDGGWAGWSCPANMTAVGGGIDSNTNPVGGNGVAATGAPAVDGFSYPTYPHHTFGSGETGYVVHDLPDGLGNTISFHIDCQPN